MHNEEIFFRLTDYIKQGKFDDEYLALLVEFWENPHNKADGAIFYARYALANGNVDVALEYALSAFEERKINWELWRILRDCYNEKGDKIRAIYFAGLASKFYKEPVNIDLPRHELGEALDMLSLASGKGDYAPVAVERMMLTDNGIESKCSMYAGEYLPAEYQEEYRLFGGAYVDEKMLDYKGRMLEKIKNDPDMVEMNGASFTYDLIKVKDYDKCVEIDNQGEELFLPLVGAVEHQKIDFRTKKLATTDYLGKWACSFFKIKEPVTLTSNDKIYIGEPIRKGHNPKRKKVVINVLLDALCWRAVIERNYELVPNIIKFFKKGIIFNNHFSVSEYTYPSVPTIETGMYPYHSQIFNEKGTPALATKYKSISERMKELGYYCVQIIGDSSGVYNGTMRGFDRIISVGNARIYEGVERALHHMEAFADVDQYLYIHTQDTHPWGAHSFQLPLSTQTAFDLDERSMKDEKKRTSVYLPNRPIYHHWNAQGIRDCDDYLKHLFDYLEEHYNEDDYFIQVYSDHGVPIYDEKNYVLSRHQTGAAYMMRGAGVPEIGFVEELTSAIDIYPAMAKVMGFAAGDNVDGNLPEALGGKPRDYTVSMSMYPGIPFMICIRTKYYECRGESREILDEDGRIDLREMKVSLFKRNSDVEIHDAEVMNYFLPILKKETVKINNEGLQWPDMREARKAWYAKD